MATIVANATGGTWNSTNTGLWVGGVAPTAADDVQIPAGAGAISIAAGAVCRSLDCTGYTGTLTHLNASTCTIGDGTAGLSNIALKLVAGMTYTANTASALFSFVSTSATQQTIDFGGKSYGTLTINGAGSNYAITSNMTAGFTTSTVTLTAGTLHADGATDNSGLTHTWGTFSGSNSNTRTINLGTANITLSGTGTAWNTGTVTGLTLTAGTSTLTFSGASITFTGGAKTFATVVITGSGTKNISTGSTFGTLTVTGTANKTDNLVINGTTTVTGTLTITGNSAINRIHCTSATITVAATITCTGATVSTTNVDFRDITFARTTAGDLDLTNAGANSVGDCGGNTRTGGTGVVTFTTSATQTWSGTTSGNWSTNAWTSRVPLPQDDVVISSAFSASQIVTMDMPRIGRSINWTGTTGNPLWTFGTAGIMYGSLTLVSGMTMSGGTSLTIYFAGTYTLTSAGVSLANGLVLSGKSGSLTLQDALNTGSNSINFQDGTINTNGFSVTSTTLISNSGRTRNLTFGASNITTNFTSGATLHNWSATGLTLSAASSTYTITSTSASAMTMAMAALTHGNLSIAGGAGAGSITFTGNSTWSNLWQITGGVRTLVITPAATITFLGGTNFGNGTNVITINTGGLSATFTDVSGPTIAADYLNLTNIVATQTSKWYAGTHSTDGGGNTNWIFTDPPGAGTNESYTIIFN